MWLFGVYEYKYYYRVLSINREAIFRHKSIKNAVCVQETLRALHAQPSIWMNQHRLFNRRLFINQKLSFFLVRPPLFRLPIDGYFVYIQSEINEPSTNCVLCQLTLIPPPISITHFTIITQSHCQRYFKQTSSMFYPFHVIAWPI